MPNPINQQPFYLKMEYPLYTRVTEDGDLIQLGTFCVEVPVTVEPGERVSIVTEDFEANMREIFEEPAQ